MNTNVVSALSRGAWVLIVFGIIAVLFGLVAIAWPGRTAVALAWAFGVMALAEGVTSLIALFRKDVPISKGWVALYAVASIAFGCLAVLNPLAVAGVMLMFLAAWLIVAGIFRIIFAIRVRKQVANEWLLGLSGALAIVLGVMLIAYPGAGLVTMALWIGVAAMIYGVLQILTGWRMRKVTQRF
ncbi:uncharacterized membrane protein HdeD (DUF308 family) [Lysobacter niastensis]|uniref:Uncharacterized membrane protein HdeD (DUF308 family) n=1 Tax=Lysobacter niastensis TaxID=380629 RepID=A0ABU1W5W0_9GAMM|nr:DUF308 domain-containing protein [Lysobacter niastensis]MDR7132973.1 uncharacterized membrane protein HdeD (DUF308 family) [Lysobacter niastensis]